ncbi:hypothetical protein ABN324_04335 [Providencia alcalifaciens]|uniref:hypothetical protein n=1 Tax=Providencia TaxID=586 RepID=UPI001FF96F6B|nr:hypothetical protein [Providencia rettgeri]
MDLVSIGIAGFLFIVLIILLVIKQKEKKNYEAQLIRYKPIIDAEKEAKKILEATSKEEKDRLKNLEKEEQKLRRAVDAEVLKKRKAIDEEVKEKTNEIESKEYQSQRAIEEQKEALVLLKEDYNEKRKQLVALTEKLTLVNDSVEMLDYGIYKPRFDYHDSKAYQEAIVKNKEKQKKINTE